MAPILHEGKSTEMSLALCIVFQKEANKEQKQKLQQN